MRRLRDGACSWGDKPFELVAACAPSLRRHNRNALERMRMRRSMETTNLNAGRFPTAAAGDPTSEILKNSRTIAVVGLSSRSHRPSYGVAQYLQSAGYRIIPVNPQETEILGEKCYARLEDIPEHVDIVDIFRRSGFVPEIVESAIRIGARGVWMQEGVINHESAERARSAGLFVIMDTCILKEHIKRFRLH
jgi:predicted CoA-binding protein